MVGIKSAYSFLRPRFLLDLLVVALCVVLIRSVLVASSLSAAQETGAPSPTPQITASSPQPAEQPKVTVDPDGTVHAPPVAVPFSSLASPEAKKAFLDRIAHPLPTAAGPDIEKIRRVMDEQLFLPGLEAVKALYPVTIEPAMIGGIQTDIVTPKSGIAPKNKHRVLINLHGGGFIVGARFSGQGESVPVAGLARIKVITVDYRMFPEHRFPAASEDVAAVYRELLKQYKPENIGIYGSSAGGILTAEAVAWFQKEKLPRPGAIGVFYAGAIAGVQGDSAYTAPPLSMVSVPPPGRSLPYFADIDPKDPLASPAFSLPVLSKFPPTLVITATRDQLMSAAVYSHSQLVKAGVEAQLHVWEGLGHGALDPEIPEWKDIYDVIVKFFDRHLGM